jgi:hypothetical protein
MRIGMAFFLKNVEGCVPHGQVYKVFTHGRFTASRQQN